MGRVDSTLVAARTEKLFFYSPYNFLRTVAVAAQQQLFGAGLAHNFGQDPQQRLFSTGGIQFLYSFLPWDTNFFGAPIYKLFTVLFAADISVVQLAAAVEKFLLHAKEVGSSYLFVELPIEDTVLMQALGMAGWRTVETRLNFYHDRVADFDHSLVPVRKASLEEAESIGRISAAARNIYDRFHADAWFGNDRADAFLHRYAAAAVEGYCDAVLVPDEPGVAVDSFLAISDTPVPAISPGFRSSRIVLTAVGPTNRGWHLKLVAATLQRARAMQVDYVLMTTQATNRAVFRTCEKLGFKLGSTSCVLACSF